MKVFRMNDTDWWLAPTLEEAKADYKHEAGVDDDDLNEARELTDEELDRLMYIDNIEEPKSKWTRRTFRQELARRIDAGDATKPGPFASTEY